MDASEMDYWSKIIIPIFTFILGFIASRFTLSKKEKMDFDLQKSNKSQELTKSKDEAAANYIKAITNYVNSTSAPTLDHFSEITVAGTKYFGVITVIADAILNNQLPEITVQKTYLRVIKEAFEKTLPQHYVALQDIASSKSIKYNGVLRRKDYESIHLVYDKYKLSETTI